MFLEVDGSSLFAKNDDVEDGNDSGDNGDICIEVGSTYNLRTQII